MARITNDLLSDTLNVIQLARETARAQGKASRADRLAPVADNLRTLVSEAQELAPPPSRPAQMMQEDFQTLLAIVQNGAAGGPQNPGTTPLERNQAVQAMAAGGMAELDIARSLGMTRDEVSMVLTVCGGKKTEAR